MKAVNLSKYLAYFFLAIIALLVLIVMLAFSPIGVNALVSIANKQEGVKIENASGSFYSKVTLGKLTFDNPQISINADQISLDIGLNCLFVGEACVDQFTARNVDITLLENDEITAPSAPVTDYIELPLIATLEKFAIEKINIYTKSIEEKRQKLAELSKISANISMHKVLKVNTLSIGEANVFSPTKTQKIATEVYVPVNDSSFKLSIYLRFLCLSMPILNKCRLESFACTKQSLCAHCNLS